MLEYDFKKRNMSTSVEYYYDGGGFLLQAKSNKGLLMTLARLARGEIDKLKQEKALFSCPVCKERVIIKAGSKMIPHFAHQSVSDCPSREGGEGAYHEQGKLLLYQWLEQQQLDVTLEAYIPEINQRPDILLQLKGRQIAFEYQCARIPVVQIKQRNEGYKKAGIIPIWIIGANHFKRQTSYHIKMDQFITHFIHQFSSESPLLLFFFCPNTHQFITTQDLCFTSNGQALGRIKATSLQQIHFPGIFRQHAFLPNEIGQLWKREKQQFRLSQNGRLYGRELAWRQWLYSKETYREHLPSIIHLPVKAQYRMKTPTWDWQSRLCLELLHPMPLGQTFSLISCQRLLQRYLYPQHEFPLIISSADAIEQYLQLLISLKIIQQRTSRTFQKINSISFYHHIEEASIGDNRLMNQLMVKTKQNTSMFH